MQALPPSILVVDPDDPVRDWASGVLRGAGYRVVEAAEALAALRVLNDPPGIALIVTAHDLPGALDGIELTRLARGRWPSVPILLVQAAGRPAARDGLDGLSVLDRPCSSEALLGAVATLLDGGLT